MKNNPHARLTLSTIVAASSLVLLSCGAALAQPDRGVRLAASDSVRTLPAVGKRYALIIGVDQYADTQITTLGGASNDAKTLANALVQYSGFPGDQVTLLASDQPAERLPTRGNILRRLSNMAAVVPPDGLLLISFAGHGIERGGQAFLLPSDSQVSNDVDLLEQTAINVSQIKDRIKKIGVRQVLIILDACRNDPVGRSNADNPLTPAYTRGFNFDIRNREVQAFVTLYATEVGHRAYEFKEKRQGYFTWILVEGLRGGAANAKGEVTLANLVKYLQERVPKRVLQDLGPGKDQKPFAVVEGYRADELVLAVRDPKAAAQPPYIPDTSTPATGATRETAIELKSKEGEVSLVDTTWTGSSPESGEYTMKFLKDGALQYIISVMQNGVTAPRIVKGTWKQSGKNVQIVIGNSYSVLQGTLDGGIMKGDGTNQEGTTWKWTLFKKE
ncbi:MAG TPA: caspase family protein, partial [Pyrinomonadaceae bacterium]